MRPSMHKPLVLSLPLVIGALIAAGSALTGCTPTSEPMNSTPPTVSYNVTGNTLTEANARADRYCSGYGVQPRLLSVQNGVATYSCGSSTAAVPSTTSPTVATPPATVAPAYPGTSPVVR
jgi:hypothetical protein